jgi:BspA type Leucine rich repeat region (6 copies)/Chitobiase/beta-hexosaminidase C-terminal domain/Bacterial Ig domain
MSKGMKFLLSSVVILTISLSLTGCQQIMSFLGLSHPPNVSISSPQNGASITTSTITVVGLATDLNNNVNQVSVWIKENPTVVNSTTSFQSNGSWSITLNLQGMSNGALTVIAEAQDTYGDKSADASASIILAIGASLVATPTFSPADGNYSTAQTVSITTTTPGAFIRYTTDGVTIPTEMVGTVYTGAITVATSETIKAIAYESGWTDSVVATASYTISIAGQVATPTFTPAAGIYTVAQTVAISTTTPGATIRYTTDGSTPTETYGTVYSGTNTVSGSETIKAIAYESGWTDSVVATASYTISIAGQVATPTFSPVAGSYTTNQSVQINCATSGATIHYTTDNSTPTSSSPTYSSSPISVAGDGTTETIKAYATKAGMTDSAIGSANYAINYSDFAITYDANGGSGSVPIDINSYAKGATVTVLGNTGNLTNGSKSFAGWTTSTTGPGASYAASATFSFGTANVTLYAIWIPANLTFTSSGTSITLTGYASAPNGSLSIPPGVTSIAAHAFDGCSGLTGVSIPSSVTSIGDASFARTALTSVTIPLGVTLIDSYAFQQCSGLASVTFPSGITTIGTAAFAQTSLTNVNFPSSVTTIGSSEFAYCSQLSNVTIPSTVTTILDAAFAFTALTSVTIPSNVNSIGNSAFAGSGSLSNVIVLAVTPPSMSSGSNAFASCSAGLQILVPSGTLSIYKATSGWSDYASNIVSP